MLVVITVFAMSGSIASETRFQEFDSRAACEAAREGIVGWIEELKGPLARKFFVACYPKR